MKQICWRRLSQYAREGFPVSEVIAYYLAVKPEARIGHYPGFSDTYMPNGHDAGKKGEMFKNPRLGKHA